MPGRPGRFAAGGKLQMLAVTGDRNYDTATGQRVGEVLDTHWVDIDEPDPSDAEDNPGAVYSQGRAKGGCRFLCDHRPVALGTALSRGRRRTKVRAATVPQAATSST